MKSTSSRKSIGLSPSRVESVWVQAVDFKSTSSGIQVKSSRIGGLKSLPGLCAFECSGVNIGQLHYADWQPCVTMC